jgi:hypothetical protein
MHVIKAGVETDLLLSIDEKRNQMLKVAALRGLQNYETVKESRELDLLIIRYQRKQLIKVL